MRHFIKELAEVNDNLKKFWGLESIGFTHDDPKISETHQVQQIFHKTVKFIGGCYEIQLSWEKDWKE